jgi:hypothetical protein
MTHNVTELPQVKDNKLHVKRIFLYMCQICLAIFFTHGVPNTPQLKPTEDDCEAYFTQHVSNVTLCQCQIYGAPATSGYRGLIRGDNLRRFECHSKRGGGTD